MEAKFEAHFPPGGGGSQEGLPVRRWPWMGGGCSGFAWHGSAFSAKVCLACVQTGLESTRRSLPPQAAPPAPGQADRG